MTFGKVCDCIAEDNFSNQGDSILGLLGKLFQDQVNFVGVQPIVMSIFTFVRSGAPSMTQFFFPTDRPYVGELLEIT